MLLFFLAATTFAQSRYDVAKKADFTDALTAIAALPAGSTAYVYISGNVDVGTLKSGYGNPMASTLRNIHFIGVNDKEGNKATLSMEMQMPVNNTEVDGFSLHYENLKLRQTQGIWGNSKHLMNFKDANKHYIDTLEFINCELTELCRSIFRGQVNGAGENYAGAGTLKVFRMENCTVHNGFRQYDALPAIYLEQPVGEITFKNNTFYDLTYLNSLVSFGNVNEKAGRQPVRVVFENNTILAYSRSSLLDFGAGVQSDSEFHIKNNIILQPNWIDDMNGRQNDNKDIHEVEGETWTDRSGNEYVCRSLTEEELQERIDRGVVLTGIQGGLVQLENNMLFGYKYQNMADMVEAGDIIPIGDDENEKAEFSSLAMEDVPFAWTDFSDAQNDYFQISTRAAAYTAGKNGAPLGDENNYTDSDIKLVTVNVKVEGSKSASVTISPDKAVCMAGDEITLTADCNGSLNTFKGWSNGMTEPTITITLEDDLDITANFEEISYFAVWNLDDISSNNVVKTPPVAVNYGAGATLDYARYIVEDETYKWGQDIAEMTNGYDGAKRAIQTRNNKVTGDIRNCFLINTPKTQFVAGEEGKADYLIINANEALAASKLQFYVASDNITYNTYVISVSADGKEWNDVATFDMTGKVQTNQWYLVEAELPELAAGSMVRIKGIESSGMEIPEEMKEQIDEGIVEMQTEFLFLAEIIIMPNDEKPIIEDLRTEQTLELATIPVMTYGDDAYTLPHNTTEGLTLTWSVNNDTVASVNGNKLNILGSGMATVTASQTGNKDYKPFVREFILTVAKAALTIKANDVERYYGEDNPEFTFNYEGFVYDETEDVLTQKPVVTTTATTDSPVGTYPITVGGAEADNYTIEYINGTLTVKEKSGEMVEDTNDIVTANEVTLKAGENTTLTVSLNITEEADFNGYQFNLYLPEGISVATNESGSFLVTEKTGRNKIVLPVDDGSVFFYTTADKNHEALYTGPLMDIELTTDSALAAGDYTLRIERVVCATRDNKMVSLPPSTVNVTVEKEAEEETPAVVTADDVEGDPAGRIKLPVYLNNATDINAFYFDLTLPKGIVVSKDEEGQFIASFTGDYGDTMLLSCLPWDASMGTTNNVNTWRFIATPKSDDVFRANAGRVMSVMLDVDKDMAGGVYTARMNVVKLVEATDGASRSGQRSVASVSSEHSVLWTSYSTITIKTQKHGDVNGDFTVDVADIATVINVMSGSADVPSASADVNHDGVVDVADIATIINIMAANARLQQLR